LVILRQASSPSLPVLPSKADAVAANHGITSPLLMLATELPLMKVTAHPPRQLTKATEPQKKLRRLPLPQSWTTPTSHLPPQLLRRHLTAMELLMKSCPAMEHSMSLPATTWPTWA